MPLPSGPKAERIGFLLTRVVVPLWVLSGAIMKLLAKTPTLLPKNIWTAVDDRGGDLLVLLFVLIALEFFAIGVMFFLPRFARFMAIWMLGVFCLILIGEMMAGNTKCGCLGSFSPPPIAMLSIDATLLLLVLLFRPPKYDAGWLPKVNFMVATAWTLVFGVITGVIILSERKTTLKPPSTQPALPGAEDPANPDPALPDPTPGIELPPYFTMSSAVSEAMQGQRFLDTDLGRWVDGWPEDLEAGPQYVMFYRRSCDHCQSFLETHVQGPPAVPMTLVAIPEKKSGFEEDRWLPMEFCKDCVSADLELPVGVDYIITPPLVVALVDGMVDCVKESAEIEEGAGFDPEAARERDCLVFGI